MRGDNFVKHDSLILGQCNDFKNILLYISMICF